jgi:hypothetical protein
VLGDFFFAPCNGALSLSLQRLIRPGMAYSGLWVLILWKVLWRIRTTSKNWVIHSAPESVFKANIFEVVDFSILIIFVYWGGKEIFTNHCLFLNFRFYSLNKTGLELCQRWIFRLTWLISIREPDVNCQCELQSSNTLICTCINSGGVGQYEIIFWKRV